FDWGVAADSFYNGIRFQYVPQLPGKMSVNLHKSVRLRIACDHAGLGVSTYYKLRNQMKNQ
ncbi:hypothetical protein ACNHGM_004460, partial [Escherichia coli]